MEIIDNETLLFIYSSVCKFYNIPYSDDDITDDGLNTTNWQILYLVKKAIQEIVIKTNRDMFPTDLKYLVVDIVLNSYEVLSKESSPETNQNITSMSEAGRSVSFGATSTWQTKYGLLLQQQIANCENQINKYKLLYKVECPYGKN